MPLKPQHQQSNPLPRSYGCAKGKHEDLLTYEKNSYARIQGGQKVTKPLNATIVEVELVMRVN